jgi:ribosomal protein L11 methyltransferase
VAAEAWFAGATGVEEREEPDGTVLLLYAPAQAAGGLRRVILEAVGEGDRVSQARAVAPVDWSQAWREGLEPVFISDRLVIRPSFAEVELGPQQRELVIDPGQAFGTGSHASTRLALEWIDWLAREGRLGRGSGVLDVGTGTGVLALAALSLGAASALGFDLDRAASREARSCALANQLDESLQLFSGTIRALAPRRFELVTANLLRSEMLPLAGPIAERVAPGGAAVLSGLLLSERETVERDFGERGLRIAGLRWQRDAAGDCWLSLLMTR